MTNVNTIITLTMMRNDDQAFENDDENDDQAYDDDHK